MQTRRVTVLPYDRAWETAFLAIRAEIEAALGDRILGVEHIGSTAVLGMSAKPCIDLDVVIADRAAFPTVKEGLAAIGYRHEGDLGIPDREAFCYEGKCHLMLHHLYVCPRDSRELFRHLTFRDFLRAHPEAVATYSRIKEEAARLYPDDVNGYMAHKSPCILALYRECGLL